MKLEDILSKWEEDCKLDKTELGDEAILIPKLHHKYWQIYLAEKLHLRQLEEEFNRLKLDKYEFYTQGPNEETVKKGWKLPAKGMILKSDLPMYMNADDDIVKISLRIGTQQEKIGLLDSIIKSIGNRNFIIRIALDDIKFKNGA
jgi:hypothetical protein